VGGLAVALARGLAGGAEHRADSGPGVPVGAGERDRVGQDGFGFGLGAGVSGLAHGSERRGVFDLAEIGVVALETDGELLGLVDDLLDSEGASRQGRSVPDGRPRSADSGAAGPVA